MAIYNPKSLKAEEFINDEEIKATIAYAEENKHNEAQSMRYSKRRAPKSRMAGTFAPVLTTVRHRYCSPATYPKR